MAFPHGLWVGLQIVIVVFPDHTRLLLNITKIVFLKQCAQLYYGAILLHFINKEIKVDVTMFYATTCTCIYVIAQHVTIVA